MPRLPEKKQLKRVTRQGSYGFLDETAITSFRDRRLEKGLTQGTYAKRVGTKQSAISRFESGRYNPSIEFLSKLADALGTSIEVRLSGVGVDGASASFKEGRIAKKMTQGELAKRVGTKQSAISRFESGRYNPSIEFLSKLAEALGTSIEVRLK